MDLTPRQKQVAGLVARGLSNKGISRETGLSVDTVKAHVRDAAGRIPGAGPARYKLAFFVLTTEEPADGLPTLWDSAP